MQVLTYYLRKDRSYFCMSVQPEKVHIDELRPEEHGFLEECSLAELRERIRVELLAHLALIGLNPLTPTSDQTYTKDLVRARHAAQRAEFRESEQQFLARHGHRLLPHFAEGHEVDPSAVNPSLSLVLPDTEDAALFRLATLLWSVPVSRGYGRRLRFLVRDQANGKLLGIFALTDPVFNLQARDSWIGWDVNDRRLCLVNVMDAHIVGAVPPYSSLLGGKVTAALMTSQEVCDAFAAKYTHRSGIISQQYKHAQLVLITVTSALGRSSLYNRLKLPGTMEFQRIGQTAGWGHFHIPQPLFLLMRELLHREEHKYASGHKFGQGPNWRLRVAREAVKRVGLDPQLLRHGISREVYASPLASNWREYLCGTDVIDAIVRPSAATIGASAVNRWLIPRSQTRLDYQQWTRKAIWEQLIGRTHP
jgi:hypothetical protein